MIHPLHTALRRLPIAVLLLALSLPRLAHAQWFPSDQGVYRVYQQDHLLGTEGFTFEQRGDSAIVISVIHQLLPRPARAPDTLTKNVALLFSAQDGSMRGYQSQERLNGDPLSRALEMSADSYTSYRETPAGGFGDTYARPPGRFYLVDPQVFVLFDVICRDMAKQQFDERSIAMVYLAGKDSVVNGRVTRLGKESIRIGAETLATQKLKIKDPWSEFLVWMTPSGQMLRLTLPAVGLRVDRDPETLKTGRRLASIQPPPIGVPQVIAPDPPPAARPRVTPDADSLPPPPGR